MTAQNRGSRSPFACPAQGIPIARGHKLGWPRADVDRRALNAELQERARALLQEQDSALAPLTEAAGGALKWVRDRHFLIIGCTGGIGTSLMLALLRYVGERGSVTGVARDAPYTVSRHLGSALGEAAHAFNARLRIFTDGVGLAGRQFERLTEHLKMVGARDVVYLHAASSAYSGVLAGFPPIYLKDLDAEGHLLQWQLPCLSSDQTRHNIRVMGHRATRLPGRLRERDITVASEIFFGWRGSQDLVSRLPDRIEYGRQGAYSTSLWLPKDVIDRHVVRSAVSSHVKQIHFLPLMRTHGLEMTPGGALVPRLYETLLELNGLRLATIPALAIAVLAQAGSALKTPEPSHCFRHDRFEEPMDRWLQLLMLRLTADPDHAFYYRNWLRCDERPLDGDLLRRILEECVKERNSTESSAP